MSQLSFTKEIRSLRPSGGMAYTLVLCRVSAHAGTRQKPAPKGLGVQVSRGAPTLVDWQSGQLHLLGKQETPK